MIRDKAIPALVVVLTASAVIAILLLQSQASTVRQAQLDLASLKAGLTALQAAPFQSSSTTGGSPARARVLIKRDRAQIDRSWRSLRGNSPLAILGTVGPPLRANFAAVEKIYAIGASGSAFGARADRLVAVATRAEEKVTDALDRAGREYNRRGGTADTRATVGSIAVIGLLMLGFLFLYRRAAGARGAAEELAGQNEALAAASHREARSDALTGLGNRRALLSDLAGELAGPAQERQLAVVVYDLDGFKQYNDTFGHPAGDALLARLGGNLGAAMASRGTAYRMGGDEFCVLVRIEAGRSDEVTARGCAALSESGEAFAIGSSFGVALMPSEATSSEGALQLADRRMYEDKAGRSSASRQSADVLLEVLNERSVDLREHIKGVAARAIATAEQLGLSEHEVSRIGLAAELHDIGKAAIPDTILDKPGPLDPSEEQFIHAHTVIGERILLAAPSLAPLAGMVRSSHERFDGGGYPDGLRGGAIPQGARVIAVCDAHDAMCSDRPYQGSITAAEANAELRRHAGGQFDPEVVEAFLNTTAIQAGAGPGRWVGSPPDASLKGTI